MGVSGVASVQGSEHGEQPGLPTALTLTDQWMLLP